MTRDRDDVGSKRRRLEAIPRIAGSDLPKRGEGVRDVEITQRLDRRDEDRPDGYLGRHRNRG